MQIELRYGQRWNAFCIEEHCYLEGNNPEDALIKVLDRIYLFRALQRDPRTDETPIGTPVLTITLVKRSQWSGSCKSFRAKGHGETSQEAVSNLLQGIEMYCNLNQIPNPLEQDTVAIIRTEPHSSNR